MFKKLFAMLLIRLRRFIHDEEVDILDELDYANREILRLESHLDYMYEQNKKLRADLLREMDGETYDDLM